MIRAFAVLCGAFIAVAALHAIEPSPEVKRYYGMLRSRPQFGVVFDRFTDAWFVSGTSDGLREFLEAQADAPDATAQDRLLLALFHTRQGNEVEALAAFTQALKIAPGNTEGWQERARLEMRMLDFSAALKSLDTALAQHPEEKMAVDLAKLRGRVLLRTDKPDDALRAWRDLLKAHPDDEDLAEEVTDLQLEEGLTMEAAATMQALIERTKDAYAKVGRKLRLADILVRAGKKEHALTQLGECLAQSGRDTWIEGEVLAQIDRIFRREDNVSGLTAHLEKLGVAGESPRVAVQHQLARAQAEMGDKDKALATYAALLTATPGRRDLRESYLDVLERFEKFSDAIAQTKLLIEQNAGDKELQLRLAALQQRAGNAKAADEALNAYLAATGTTEYDHLRVARTLEQWGRKADAKAAFTRMASTFSQSTTAREAQAHFLHRTGDKDEALAIWRALAAEGGLEQVLGVAQALLTRMEPKTALEVLRARQDEFGQETRYLTPLITAAIAMNEHALAVPWALERLRLTTEAAMLDDAIRQAMDVLEGAKAIEPTMEKLKALPSPPLPERALLAAMLEKWGSSADAEKVLSDAPPDQRVAAQERLVRLVESRKDWPRAGAEMEKLIAMPEGRTSQHVQRLVDFKQRAGEPEAALKLIVDWKTLSPGAAQPWLTEAALLGQLGKRQESIQVLRAAGRKFEDDDNVVVALATAYADGGQFADAEQIFMKLVEKSETLDEKLRWVAGLAQMAYSRGTIKPVVEKFQERQRTNRSDATPWLALAEIHKVANNKVEQRACLAEALRLRSKDVTLMQEIARVDEDNNDWKSALKMLEQAATLDATPRTKQLIAVLQLRWGDENAAFRTLIELCGGAQMEAKDAMKLADAMMAREEWKRAAEFMEPFVQRAPGDYRLRYMRAIALSEDGRHKEAADEFVLVAKTTGELPEVLKRKPAAVSVGYASVIAKSQKDYPPGTWQFMDIMQSGYGALQHVYRRQMSGVVSSMSNSSIIQLPTTVEQAHAFALVHLVGLMREEPGDTTTRLKQQLRNGGYVDVDSLFALEPKAQSAWSLSISEEALKSRPDDAVLHAAWLMTTGVMRRDQPVADASICQRAFDLFKEKYPRLALYAANTAMRTEPKMGLPMVEHIVQKLEASKATDDDEYGQSTYLLSSFLGGGQRIEMTMRADLPEELRKRICQLLLAGAKMPDDGTSYRVAYAANGLRAEGDWERYVKLWDAIFSAFHQADPAKRKVLTAAPRIYSSNQTKPLLAPLEFPPVCASMPTAFAMLMRYEDPVNTHIEQWHRPGPEADYAPVAKLLETVKDPVLRLVLAYKSDQKAAVESDLNARMAAPRPGSDDLLLAASYFSSNNDHVRAADLLVRCNATPLEAAQRVSVDTALVYAVTNMSENDRQKMPATSLACAQQAVRRLRAGQLPASQRDELTSVLAALGLKEEAEQWRRIAALTPAPPSSGATVSSSTYTSSTSNVRIQKLATQGDVEGAARLAVTNLRAILVRYGSSDTSAKREAGTILRYFSVPDGKKKLLAAIDPGVNASDARLMEAGRMLEIIEEPDKARDLYTSILDRNPKHQDARVRTMILTITRNPAQAVAMLESTSWRDMAKGVGEQLVTTLRSSDKAPFQSRMRMLMEMANYLEKLAASSDRPQRGSLEWARGLVDAAAAYDNNARLPTLYEKHLDSNSYYRSAIDSDLKLRREAHDALCRALLKHPSVADSGFRALAGLAIFEGKPTTDLVPLAEKVLADQAEEMSKGPAFPAQPSLNRYIENPYRTLWRPSPAEFLMWQAWQEGKIERISSEILPLAERCMSGLSLRTLRASAQLWLSEPSSFGEAASAYGNAVNAASLGSSPYGSRAEVDVIERWVARKLPPEVIEAFLIAQLKQSRGASFSYDGGPLMVYLVERAARRDATGLDEFITRLNTALLGPESAWQKRIAPLIANRNSMYSSGDQVAAMLISTANNLTRMPGGFAVGLRLASRLGMLDNASWRSSYLTSSSLEAAQRADTVAAFLTLAPFVEEAAAFQPWATDATGQKPTLLEQFFSNARKSDPVRDAVRAHLAKQPRTFGVEFCEAMLLDNPAPALSAMLKRRATDVAKLPESRHAELHEMFTRLIPALKQPATLDPALKNALEPLMAAQFKLQQDRVDTWLKARVVSELKLDDTDYESELIHEVSALTMRDRAKARELFLHGCDLMERKESQSGWNSGNAGNGWLLRSYVLEEAMQEAPKMEMLGLSMQLFHEDTTGKLTMSGWSHSPKWGTAMMEVWKAAGGLGNNASGLEALVARTRKELGDTPPTLLAIAFYDFFAKLPQSLRVPAIKWAGEPPRDVALAPIVKEMSMAGRFFLGTDNASRTNAGEQKALQELGGLTPVWEHALAQMNDEKINPRVRLALGHHLCYRAPLSVTPAIATEAAALALQAMKEDHCIHGYQHAWIMRAYCRLPVDDAWRDAAQRQWEAWIARTSAKPAGRTLRYDPCDWDLHNMILLAGRAGKEEWIARISTDHTLTLSNEPSELAVLVAAGRPKEAVAWLKENWKESTHDYESGLLWSTEVTAGLPAFREATGSPELALLGEIMLALLPDPPKPDHAGIPGFQDRTTRLTALAEKLRGAKFGDESMRTRCLALLAQEYETYGILAKEYDAAAAQSDVAAAAALGYSTNRALDLKPVRASISRKAWEGNVQPAIEAYDKALAAKNSSRSAQRTAVKEVGSDPLLAVPYKLARTENADWRPLLAFVDHVLAKTPTEFYDEHIADAVSLKLLIHLASGESDTIAQWRKGLTVDQTQAMQRQFEDRFELGNLVRDYGGLPKARVPVAGRVALVSALLKDEWVRRRYPDTGGAAQNLIATVVTKSRIFTPEEFVTAWKPIAEALPRKGRTAAESADFFAQNNKLPEAVTAFDLAIAQTEKDTAASGGFRFRKAEVLERMNRKDEARVLLEGLDEKKLGAAVRGQRETMLKRLGVRQAS